MTDTRSQTGLTAPQLRLLFLVARRWAGFQRPDSLKDQKTDARLFADAIEAREQLLLLIEELDK